MNDQLARHILMVRPAAFGFNEQTAASNDYQRRPSDPASAVAERARAEFDATVRILRSEGIDVLVVEDTPHPPTPDAVFPNNWVQFAHDGTVHLFPMATPNRAAERRPEILAHVAKRFDVRCLSHWTHPERFGRALEGTGSIVYHHPSRTAYACLSPRTDAELFDTFCQAIGYRPVAFHSTRRNGTAQYHTNVVMCIGDGFAVVGLDSVRDEAERAMLTRDLEANGLEVVPITDDQLEEGFAGNMLEVLTGDGARRLVLSRRAEACLTDDQRAALDGWTTRVPVPLDIIETVGGGSARCMMAEVFLPERA